MKTTKRVLTSAILALILATGVQASSQCETAKTRMLQMSDSAGKMINIRKHPGNMTQRDLQLLKDAAWASKTVYRICPVTNYQREILVEAYTRFTDLADAVSALRGLGIQF